MLDWNLVVWRRGGGGGGGWWWWWWWCQVFDAKNSATHYPCLFSSVALEEEEEGEVKLLMPKFWKKIKLSYYPFLLFLLNLSLNFLCKLHWTSQRQPPHHLLHSSQKFCEKKLNFSFSIPSPKSKPQRYTHPSSPIPIKSLWKKVFEFGGVQNCPDLQFLRERETHTHTHTQAQKVSVPILEQCWVK